MLTALISMKLSIQLQLFNRTFFSKNVFEDLFVLLFLTALILFCVPCHPRALAHLLSFNFSRYKLFFTHVKCSKLPYMLHQVHDIATSYLAHIVKRFALQQLHAVLWHHVNSVMGKVVVNSRGVCSIKHK